MKLNGMEVTELREKLIKANHKSQTLEKKVNDLEA